MGVIYRSGDDVRDLLIPYLCAKGCRLSGTRIRELYIECSLGRMSSGEFWRSAGVAPHASDEEYCKSHQLTDHIADTLRELRSRGVRTACLSNDVSEWSVLLRRRFGLENLIETWVVSGDVGVRKPSPEIYRTLLGALGCAGPDVLLVDDSVRNLDAAAALGLWTLCFAPARLDRCGHAQVSSMEELRLALVAQVR